MKKFLKPEYKIVKFENFDVITLSAPELENKDIPENTGVNTPKVVF